MEQFERAQVIMLPTKNKINGSIVKDIKEESKILHIKQKDYCEHEDFVAQHLYIISDDEIKEGDNVIDLFTKELLQVGNKGENISIKNIDRCKKIIATTDTSLIIEDYNKEVGFNAYNLPQPSQQFIEKYIESYNKNEVITDILVEYEVDKITNACTCKENLIECSNRYYDGIDECCSKKFPNGEYWDKTFKLKVNPKDNTITIKKLKDSWNREEVKQFAIKAFQAGFDYCGASHLGCPDESNWIEENL